MGKMNALTDVYKITLGIDLFFAFLLGNDMHSSKQEFGG